VQHELEIRILRNSRDELMADYEAVSELLEARQAIRAAENIIDRRPHDGRYGCPTATNSNVSSSGVPFPGRKNRT
jgi:hypothetical protein